MHDTADTPAAAASIAEVYALGPGPWTMTPVTRGALGRIWKLAGNGGPPYAVKELLFGCDEQQVDREAALRSAAESLGIASPRLHPDRRGAHVSRLAASSGESYVKLYDWVDGTRADASDPVILDWFGRTMALLHTAGEGESRTPDSWYEECPREADWKDLHRKVQRAGLPWADDFGRFVATSAVELARWVSPSGSGDLVTSHLDLRPQNVLVGRAGPVLLDWDNAGPASAEREFARAVYVWSGGNAADTDSARRLARAYRGAGGSAVVQGPDSFSMLFATDLNYLRVQAECAVDPTVTDPERAFASGEVVRGLGSVPDLAAVSRLTEALKSVG